MIKPDKTVKRETAFIAIGVGLLTLLLHAVFLLLHRWSLSVLWGSLLGGGTAVCNFFLMGLTVQSALQKSEKAAANTVRLSMALRMAAIFVVASVGVLLPVFDIWATLIPLLFPRLTIAVRPLSKKWFPEASSGEQGR